MIYKVIISSLTVSVGVGLFAYLLGWIAFSTLIVMTISGVVGGLIAFQSGKSHNKTEHSKR